MPPISPCSHRRLIASRREPSSLVKLRTDRFAPHLRAGRGSVGYSRGVYFSAGPPTFLCSAAPVSGKSSSPATGPIYHPSAIFTSARQRHSRLAPPPKAGGILAALLAPCRQLDDFLVDEWLTFC